MITRGIVVALVTIGMLGCKDDKPTRSSAEPSTAPPVSPEPAKPADPPAEPPPAVATKPDLDMLCAKAKELQASPAAQQAALWRQTVKTIKDPDIKKGFDAIVGTEPDVQYQLALQIAKEAGAPGWTCPDLKTLFQTMK